MRLLVFYDIPDDGKRGKIADTCLDFGLDRIQYSVFAGVLSGTHQKALLQKLKSTLGKLPGKIVLLPVAQDEWDKRREILIGVVGAAQTLPAAALSTATATADPEAI